MSGKLILEGLEMQVGNVPIGDEDIGRSWQSCDDRVNDVWYEMESTMNRFFS
jgi:hypothetical protein